MRIWEKACDFDAAKGSPIGWMATIARNRALDEVRRVRPVSLEDMPEGFEPAAVERSIRWRRAARSERLAALARLPRQSRRRQARSGAARLLSRLQPRRAGEAIRRADGDDQDLAAPQPVAIAGLSGVMTLSPDDDFAAAEFALGTLDAGRARDVRRAAAAGAGTRRGDPRLGGAPFAARRGDAADRAARRLPAGDRGAHPRRRRAARLRMASRRCKSACRAGAPRRSGRASLAAMLAIGIVVREASRASGPHEFVAVLQKSADSPAFVVSINLDTRELTVAPGRGAGAGGQFLRTVDHRSEARRAALARRDRRQRRHAASGARRLSSARSSRTRPTPSPSSRPAARRTASRPARRFSSEN